MATSCGSVHLTAACPPTILYEPAVVRGGSSTRNTLLQKQHQCHYAAPWMAFTPCRKGRIKHVCACMQLATKPDSRICDAHLPSSSTGLVLTSSLLPPVMMTCPVPSQGGLPEGHLCRRRSSSPIISFTSTSSWTQHTKAVTS